MKSHPYAKTLGGGVSPSSEPISQSALSESLTRQPLTSQLTTGPVTSQRSTISLHVDNLTPCRHINRRGHHCRLFSTIPNLDLCPHHARQLQKQHQRRNDDSAAELLGDLTNFDTPDAVNALLGNLVRQLARKRIARLDAIAIAYVSQLLLFSISSMDRHDAALRAAEGADDSIPGRLIFDNPDDRLSTSDSLRTAASFTSSRTSEPQSTESRA